MCSPSCKICRTCSPLQCGQIYSSGLLTHRITKIDFIGIIIITGNTRTIVVVVVVLVVGLVASAKALVIAAVVVMVVAVVGMVVQVV